MEKFSSSPLIAGTMKWGAWGAQMNQTQQAHYIEHCLSLGINTFDCAAIYGGYTAEAECGAALAALSLKRHEYKVISKCGIEYPCAENPISLKHYDYAFDAIIRSAERSLERFKVDALDLLLLHRPSPLMDPVVVASAIDFLKKKGKILAFGVSNFPSSTLALLGEHVPIDVNQIECSLTHIQPLSDGTLDFHSQHNITTQCWSPLGSIFNAHGHCEQRLRAVLNDLSKKYGVSMSAICLAWLLKHPAGMVPVVGTTQQSHLSEMVDALNIELETIDWFRLLTASTGADVA